jgi:hypothetical protein
MLGQRVSMSLDNSIQIINARIIELTDRRNKLQLEVDQFQAKYNLETDKFKKEVIRVQMSRVKSKLYECEKILHFNQSLLSYDNRHEYQLEN